MKCYIFAAAVYCEACGEKLRETLTKSGNAPKNPADETTYDSDDFPKGPYEVTALDYPEIGGKFYDSDDFPKGPYEVTASEPGDDCFED